MADIQAIANAIIGGKREEAVELVKQAIAEGVDPRTILNDGLIAGMNVVGKKFKNNEFYVPEVLIAARAMSNHKEAATRPGALEILKPYLEEAGVEPIAKVVIGTVKGDLHDIGKNLVCMMLKGAGFDVIDLKIDVPAEKYVQAAKENNANVIGMSALLTTTMMQMKATVEAVAAAGLKGKVKIMVGGAPVTEEFARQIGADGYAADAASAVSKLKELLKLT